MSKKKKINIEDTIPAEEADIPVDVGGQDEAAPGETESAAEGITLNQEQFAELKESIEKLQGERAEYLDRLQRLQAEFDNYRKRNATLRKDSLEEGQREAIAALLPTLDNLERAVASAEAENGESAILEGVKLVHRQFQETLQKMGVEEIPCQDMPFDPEWHNAVAQEPCEEGQEENTVTEVFQKGYRQGDRVLRHSMVKVSQ